jgi:hypothetical protein
VRRAMVDNLRLDRDSAELKCAKTECFWCARPVSGPDAARAIAIPAAAGMGRQSNGRDSSVPVLRVRRSMRIVLRVVGVNDLRIECGTVIRDEQDDGRRDQRQHEQQ